MSNLSSVPRLSIETPIQVTPVISTTAYTAGDQVGGIMTLAGLLRQDTNTQIGTAILDSVTILDKASQSAAFNLLFFKVSPTLASSDNAAFSMTDANLFLQAIGNVAVGGTWTVTAQNAISQSDCNLNLPVYATSGTSIYVVAVTSSTPTYTSTSDLMFQFNFLVD